jgi:hypothetical protein
MRGFSVANACAAYPTRAALAYHRHRQSRRPAPESPMSKGMDQKKTEKKKPTKTLKEKRAEKAAKKGK